MSGMDLTDGPIHIKPMVSEEMAIVLEQLGWVRDRDFSVTPEKKTEIAQGGAET